jgi:hypothetical protein
MDEMSVRTARSCDKSGLFGGIDGIERRQQLKLGAMLC